MKLSKVLLTIFLMLAIWSCKAQNVASFTSFNMDQSDSFDYVNWYNSNVKSSAKTDTLSLFHVPSNSDLAYVHVRPMKGVVTIKMPGGREYKIDENRIWLVTAIFDKKGQILAPIEGFEISGYDFELKIDRCFECKKTKTHSKL